MRKRMQKCRRMERYCGRGLFVRFGGDWGRRTCCVVCILAPTYRLSGGCR